MRYGNLTIVSEERVDGKIFWTCRCACGNVSQIYAYSVKSGATKSCGCLRKQVSTERSTVHGMYGTPEYRAWRQMIERCKSDSKDHSYYADKGVSVCSRWQESFENFYADMGPRPSSLHSLDRENNDGNYELSNCRWVTKDIQSQNSKQSKIWVVFGVEFESAQRAAEVHGVHKGTIRNWCRGTTGATYRYPSKSGCYCYLRYAQ